MKTRFYFYDHAYGEGGTIGDFGQLMTFINNTYDQDRFSIQDSWEGHKQYCLDNDNPIEEDV